MTGPDEDRQNEIIASMTGHMIVAATRRPDPNSNDGDPIDITLDDGRNITITGWGHDWWGTHVTAPCIHCGHNDYDHEAVEPGGPELCEGDDCPGFAPI